MKIVEVYYIHLTRHNFDGIGRILTSPPYNQYPTFHEIQGFLNKCNNSVDPEHKGMRTTLSVEQIYEVHEH